MTRNQIIEKLYTGKNFNDCIGKMEPDHLREDLKMEVIAIVCEIPEEKIIGLAERKELDFFVVKIILNQIKSNSSPFAKKYRQHLVEYNGLHVNGEWENSKQGREFTKDEITFFTKRSQAIEADFNIDIEERELRELVEDMALEEIDREYWYNKGLIHLYLKHGNYRAIQAETGIPYISAYKTIQKSFKNIKQKVGK